MAIYLVVPDDNPKVIQRLVQLLQELPDVGFEFLPTKEFESLRKQLASNRDRKFSPLRP